MNEANQKKEYNIECEEIIKEILSKLTNDIEENKKYLRDQMILYKDHKYSKQILDAIIKALYSNFYFNGNYSNTLNINGIDVPYINSDTNDEIIYVNSNKLFLAEIENSVKKYLNIKEPNTKIVLDAKNLYRIILTCGEFEKPYVDENIMEDYLSNKERVISLIKKFPSLNLNYFNNTLNYLTFDLNDYSYVYHLISILSNSFINSSKFEDIMNDNFKYKLGMSLDEDSLKQLTKDNFKEVNTFDFGFNNKCYSNEFLQLSFSSNFLGSTLPKLDVITILEKNNVNSFYTVKINDDKHNASKKLLSYGFITDKDLDFKFVKENIEATIYSEDNKIIQISLTEHYVSQRET